MHFDPDGKTSRRPLLWGGVFSSLGSVSAVLISSRLFSVFTPQSILHSPFDSSFVVAVLVAATLWVLAATLVRLPVSTTHAILGAIMLQGIFLFGLSSLAWDFLVIRILLPLAGGPLAALIGIYLFERVTKRPQVPGKEKPKWVELAHWGSAAATAYAAPWSTTHVHAGATAGASGLKESIRWALRGMVLPWLVTLPAAGLLAIGVAVIGPRLLALL